MSFSPCFSSNFGEKTFWWAQEENTWAPPLFFPLSLPIKHQMKFLYLLNFLSSLKSLQTNTPNTGLYIYMCVCVFVFSQYVYLCVRKYMKTCKLIINCNPLKIKSWFHHCLSLLFILFSKTRVSSTCCLPHVKGRVDTLPCL